MVVVDGGNVRRGKRPRKKCLARSLRGLKVAVSETSERDQWQILSRFTNPVVGNQQPTSLSDSPITARRNEVPSTLNLRTSVIFMTCRTRTYLVVVSRRNPKHIKRLSGGGDGGAPVAKSLCK